MRRTLLLALASAAALSACSRSPKEEQGPFVAQGKGVAVSVKEFRATLAEQPPTMRARFATLDHRKELLENLIRFDLLASEAESRKLLDDPEVRDGVRRLLVQRLVKKTLDESAAVKVTQAEARAYYEGHLDEFVRPERLRLAHVFFRGPAGSTERARAQAAGERAVARLRREGVQGPLAFANLARDVSEDPGTKASGGDLGYATLDELAAQWSKEFSAAAAALKEPGQATGLVAAPQGFHLVKLVGRQPAVSRSFEEVEAHLVERLGRERRSKDFEQLVEGLRARAGVTIDERALETIAVAAGDTAPSR